MTSVSVQELPPQVRFIHDRLQTALDTGRLPDTHFPNDRALNQLREPSVRTVDLELIRAGALRVLAKFVDNRDRVEGTLTLSAQLVNLGRIAASAQAVLDSRQQDAMPSLDEAHLSAAR